MSTIIERINIQDIQNKPSYGKDELSKKILRKIKNIYREILEERCPNAQIVDSQILLQEVVIFLKEEFNIELQIMNLFKYRKEDFNILIYSFLPTKQLKKLHSLNRHSGFNGCKGDVIHLFNTQIGFHLYAKPFFYVWESVIDTMENLEKAEKFVRYSEEIVKELVNGSDIYQPEEEVQYKENFAGEMSEFDEINSHCDSLFIPK